MNRFPPQGLCIAPENIDDSLFRLAGSKSTWNPNFRKWDPKFRETFGDITRWTPVGNSCSAINDSVYYAVAGADKREDGAWVQTTGTAMKVAKIITTDRTAKIEYVLSQPLDITGHHGLLRYYIHEGLGDTSYEYLSTVYVFFVDGNSKYAYWADVGTGVTDGSITRFFPGWRTVPFKDGNFNQKLDGFDPTTVTNIQLWIQVLSEQLNKNPSITFDSFEFIPKLNPPIPYVLTFDGAYANHKPALAYLAARGIRANVFSTFGNIGLAGHMTAEDLQQAHNMGHIVDFHERRTTATSPTGWNTLTEQQKKESIKQSLIWNTKNGYIQSAGFAPLATQWWNDRDITGTLNPYLEYVRIGQENNLVPWNPRILGVAYDTNALTVAEEATYRAEAIASGTYYAGCIHALLAESAFTLNDFKTIVDAAIADANIKIVTFQELIETNWYAQT